MEEADNDIFYLQSPANFIVSGATGSGKTFFVLKLLTNWPFKKNMGNIIFFYNVWQPLFETFLQRFPSIKFIQGLNNDEIENENNWMLPDAKKFVNVIICDDLADQAVKSYHFSRLFTVYGHHKNIINIFITQNPFFKGPFATTINRNTHYFVLTKSHHLNVLDSLNMQLYGKNGPLKSAYQKSMNEKPFNYLLVDIVINNIQNRLRSNIFQDEYPMIIWRPLFV